MTPTEPTEPTEVDEEATADTTGMGDPEPESEGGDED